MKSKKTGWKFAIFTVLLFLFVGMVSYFVIDLTMSWTAMPNKITVRMIPQGVKMSLVAPGFEDEISVSSSEPQIARVYDEENRITYLAIYLPREELRENYLDSMNFEDGSELSQGQILKLPTGRYLKLDFIDELAKAAQYWVEHENEPEQGIVIETTYANVHMTAKQRIICEWVFRTSHMTSARELSDIIVRTVFLQLVCCLPIYALACSCIYGANLLWQHRHDFGDEESGSTEGESASKDDPEE